MRKALILASREWDRPSAIHSHLAASCFRVPRYALGTALFSDMIQLRKLRQVETRPHRFVELSLYRRSRAGFVSPLQNYISAEPYICKTI
jgi:hypothetical protein